MEFLILLWIFEDVKEIAETGLTDIGILVLLLTSSGRIVRNSNSVGTVAGFVPNFSTSVCTGCSHLCNCKANPTRAKESCTTIFFGPAEYDSKALKSVSRRAN